MAQGRDDSEAAALGWVVRSADPEFDDWAGLQDWLEGDPAHAARYQALAADAGEVASLLSPARERIRPASPMRRRWLVGALAASIAGVIGYAGWQGGAQPYVIETAAGATRSIRLEDGSMIALNGDTRVVLDRDDPRAATLERGEVLFLVKHDERRPFRVAVGEDRLVDVGTIFAVTRERGTTRVAVSEGAVEYNPGAEAVRLDAGEGLTVSDADGRVMLGAVDASAVGAWRGGRLVYRGVPLDRVATDLSRSLGVRIEAERSVAARPFRGVIVLDGAKQNPASLAPLLGVAMRRVGDRWVMTAQP